MAQVTIQFTPASPVPANGYRAKYRKKGSSDPFVVYPDNFTSSPANLTGLDDGFDYEGYLESECSEGVFSSQQSWSTNNHS